ncbi:MAG: hypothetical protein K5895_02015 [Lachnospiraceae bacterium]|nr:hypothetical protein [Lachnospiraceae bacterium]
MKLLSFLGTKKQDEETPSEASEASESAEAETSTGNEGGEDSGADEGDGEASSDNGDGEGDEAPSDAGDGGGDDAPSDSDDGSGDEAPSDNGEGGGDDAPSDNGEGGGDNAPSDNGEGGGDEAPSDSGEGGGDDAPSDSGEGGGDEVPSNAGDGDGDEDPSDVGDGGDAPAKEKPDLFLMFLHFLKTNKFLHEIVIFLCIALAFLCAVLAYGDRQKTRGIPSFQTFYEEPVAKKIAKTFLSQNMDEMLDWIYVMPTAEEIPDSELQHLKKDTAQEIAREYAELFTHFEMELTRVVCEYAPKNSSQASHIISTCHIKLTDDMELLLILEDFGNNKFKVNLMPGDYKTEPRFKKINALFEYYSSAFTSKDDAIITYSLKQGTSDSFKTVSKYFCKNAEKENTSDYSAEIAKRLNRLSSLSITIEEAYIDTYTYDAKGKTKKSALVLRCKDKYYESSFMIYQPLIVGLYGYQPNGSPTIYGNDIRSEVYNQVSLLFTS